LPLFFVLSAYLIGDLLLREKERCDTINLKAFYIRRILRIWPLYFFAPLLGCLYALLVDHKSHDVITLGAFAVMLGNVAVIRWGMDGPFGPLWSISVVVNVEHRVVQRRSEKSPRVRSSFPSVGSS
jgi:peptidoglycan/LPS O-acetylase OafA/YrhL